MKFYTPNTELNFGENQGKTLLEVFSTDKSYLDWCLVNLDHFVISVESLDELYELFPDTRLSEDAESARTDKLEEYEMELHIEDEDDEDNDPMESYGKSGEKYGWYNGYSDDVIDDAFEGDPEATWNVD